MTRIALVLASLLLVAVAASASAKELAKVSVCGADECRDVTERATEKLVHGGPPTTESVSLSEPSFVIRMSVGDGRKIFDAFETRWFPDSMLWQGADGTWMTVPDDTQAELTSLAGDLKPYGRPRKAEEDGGGGATTALAIGGPAAAALGIAALLARRRRRR